jgi:hypothetical protein
LAASAGEELLIAGLAEPVISGVVVAGAVVAGEGVTSDPVGVPVGEITVGVEVTA